MKYCLFKTFPQIIELISGRTKFQIHVLCDFKLVNILKIIGLDQEEGKVRAIPS